MLITKNEGKMISEDILPLGDGHHLKTVLLGRGWGWLLWITLPSKS